MKKLLIPAVALLALAGCDNEPETITGGVVDPQAEALKNAAPIEAPPMIQASRTFRCKDNSLIYVDFYTNDTARVRTKQGGESTVLAATDGKPPYKADGWSVSENAAHVSITAPGKGAQSCKA